MNKSSVSSILCSERESAGGLDGTGIGADSGSILEENFFEGPVLVGLIKGGGGDFKGGAVLGFMDPEGQIMAIPVDEFKGVFGFGGGISLAQLEFLNLLHIGSYCFESNMVSKGKKFKIIFTFFTKKTAPVRNRHIMLKDREPELINPFPCLVYLTPLAVLVRHCCQAIFE